MLIGFDYPFLTVKPETTDEARAVRAAPWAIPATGNDFRVYWTYLELMRAHFGLNLTYDATFAKHLPFTLVKSDLSHLPAWDRSIVTRYFLPDYTPRDYQADAIYYTLRAKRVLNADDTGLGKTIESAGAAVLHGFANPKDRRPTVVICGSGIRYQWRREVKAMFRMPGSDEALFNLGDFTVIDGSPAQRRAIYSRQPAPWVIISWEILIRDREQFMLWLLGHGGARAAIVDESYRVKNPGTISFESTADLLGRLNPDLVVLLNATPLENKLEELWAQMRLVCPWIFPSWSAFEAACIKKLRFVCCRRCGKYQKDYAAHAGECQGDGGFPWKPPFERIIGYSNLPQVKELIRDRFIRRSCDMVKEQLPELIVSNYVVELGAEQRRAYDLVAEDGTLDPQVKYGELLRRALFEFKGTKIVSTKLDAVFEILAEAGDAKVVLVSESKKFVLAVTAALGKADIKAEAITGDVKPLQRDEIIRRFTDEDLRVIVGTSAIERGPNLQAASMLVNLDLPWNPGRWKQRAGRIRRLTSKHASCRVLNLIARNTVEERVLNEVYTPKLAMFNAIFQGDISEETFAKRINLADILKTKECVTT